MELDQSDRVSVEIFHIVIYLNRNRMEDKQIRKNRMKSYEMKKKMFIF